MAEDITQLQIDILEQLRRHPKSHFPIRGLCEMFQLAATRINRAVKELENWGYTLERNKNGDLRFVAAPDVLFPHEISFGLENSLIANNIYSLDRVGSTNALAHKYAEQGEPEGTVIIAERQTAGRGRLGRSWHSPAKRGLYLSIILRPPIPPAQAPGLSLIAALSVVEAIGVTHKVKAEIKWPNDVLIAGKKLSGALTELSAEIDQVRYVVVGIGVNVNHDLADFPSELQSKATSLRLATGSPVDRLSFCRRILHRFEHNYNRFLSGGLPMLLKAIRSHSAVIERTIEFHHDGKSCRGQAIDIDEHGRLVVRVDGKLLALNSGEITLAENY